MWLTTGTADAAPRPSPDGRWIAYLSDAQPPDPADFEYLAGRRGCRGRYGRIHGVI